MANKDFPHGFFPVRTRNGGEFQIEELTLLATNAIIGVNDLLSPQADGTYDRATATATQIVGTALEAKAANDGTTVLTLIGENVVYEGQTDDGTATGTIQDALTLNFDIIVADAVNGRSIMELDEDSAATTATLPMKAVGLYKAIDNSLGEFNRLECVINAFSRSADKLGV